MPASLQPPWPYRIDACTRRDHHFLVAGDDCRYLSAYRAGGVEGINQLIRDFKCRPSIAARHELWNARKRAAVERFAAAVRRAVPRPLAEAATWVPIPSSVAACDADYDERLAQTLQLAFADYDVDVRALLRVSRSALSDHRAARRLTLAELDAQLYLDRLALASRPLGARIALFDDVLTSGKHYRCCQRRLVAMAPGVPVCGWFIARRVLPSKWWRSHADAGGLGQI
jgi:hypothetical protein